MFRISLDYMKATCMFRRHLEPTVNSAKLLIPAEVPKEIRTTHFVLVNFITTSIKPLCSQPLQRHRRHMNCFIGMNTSPCLISASSDNVFCFRSPTRCSVSP